MDTSSHIGAPRGRLSPGLWLRAFRRSAALAGTCVIGLSVAALACRRPAEPSLVLVTLEGVRSTDVAAGSLPALATAASTGWSAECAITPSPEPSVAAGSLLTGRTPAGSDLLSASSDRLAPDARPLAEWLRKAGYETAAFPGSRSIRWSSGLARGFQVFADAERDVPPAGGLPLPAGAGWDARRARRDPVETVQDGLRWLQPKHGPVFLWLHLAADPPVRGQGPGAAAPHDPLASVQSALALLREGLDESGRTSTTVLAVVGLAGAGRGEHGEWTSGLGLYDTTVRVPFVMAGPGIAPGRETAPISTTSFIARMGERLTAVLQRAGLAIGPPPSAGWASALTLVPLAEHGWRPLALARGAEWACLDDTPPLLWDLRADPGQTHDLSDAQPDNLARCLEPLRQAKPFGALDPASAKSPGAAERARVIAAMLDASALAGQKEFAAAEAQLATVRPPAGESPAWLSIQARLKVLQGDSAGASAALHTLDAVVARAPRAGPVAAAAWGGLGSTKDAARVLRAALAADPASSGLRVALAESLLAAGEGEPAVDELARLVEQEPDDPRLAERLGDAYRVAGFDYKAIGAWEKALSLGYRWPGLALKISDSRMALKDHEGALKVLEEAEAADGPSAPLLVRKGDVLLALNKPNRAIEEYRRSLPAGAGLFDEAMKIGNRLSTKGQPGYALLFYQDAAKAAPQRYEPHLKVGEVFLSQQHFDEARKAFDYALGLSPGNPLVRLELTRVAVAKKDEAEALKQIGLMKASSPPPQLLAMAASDPLFASLPADSPIRKALFEAGAPDPKPSGNGVSAP